MNKYFTWDYVRSKYPEEADLMNNIEDILYCAKTGREHPIHAILTIQEKIISYYKNLGGKQ